MQRFDYTHYRELMESFDYEADDFSPEKEDFDNYVKLLMDFDPEGNPPKWEDRLNYVSNCIVPIIKEHCKDMAAVLEIQTEHKGVTAAIIAGSFEFIHEDAEILKILNYASTISIKPCEDKIRLELLFITL